MKGKKIFCGLHTDDLPDNEMGREDCKEEIGAKVLLSEGKKVGINLTLEEVRLFSGGSQELIELYSGGE